MRRTIHEQPVFDPDTTYPPFSHELVDGFGGRGQLFHGVERSCHDVRKGYMEMLILSRPRVAGPLEEMAMVRPAFIDSVA